MKSQRRTTVFAQQDGGLSSLSFPRTFSTLYFLFSAIVRRGGLKILTWQIEEMESFYFACYFLYYEFIYRFVIETSKCRRSRIFVALANATSKRGLHGAGVVARDTCAARQFVLTRRYDISHSDLAQFSVFTVGISLLLTSDVRMQQNLLANFSGCNIYCKLPSCEIFKR